MSGKIFSDIYNESGRDTGDITSTHLIYVKKKVNDAGRAMWNRMGYAHKRREADIDLTEEVASYLMSSIASDWDEDTPVNVFYRDAAQRRQKIEVRDESEWNFVEDLDSGHIFDAVLSKRSGNWKIYFSFKPDASFIAQFDPVKLEYQKKWTELSSDSDVPDFPTAIHQVLVYWTNMLISAEMGDNDAVLIWKGLRDEELGQMNARQVRRTGKPKKVYPSSAVRMSGQRRVLKDYKL